MEQGNEIIELTRATTNFQNEKIQVFLFKFDGGLNHVNCPIKDVGSKVYFGYIACG